MDKGAMIKGVVTMDVIIKFKEIRITDAPSVEEVERLARKFLDKNILDLKIDEIYADGE